MNEETKHCAGCNRNLPRSSFWRDITKKDLLCHRCKECGTKSQKERYSAAYQRERRRKDELRYKARTILNNLVKEGKIIAEPCWACGAKKSEAHHLIYALPDKVIWLCRKHHSETHHDMKYGGK